MHRCISKIRSGTPLGYTFLHSKCCRVQSVVGKVDEILGPMNQVFFTVKPQEGIVATSFKEGDKFYIGPDKLLPLERFLPKPKAAFGTMRSFVTDFG
jgi:rRNA processing protein Gar1